MSLVAVNKVDMLESEEISGLKEDASIIPISALTGFGLDRLVRAIMELVETTHRGDADGRGKMS